jgi:hypothetical protein
MSLSHRGRQAMPRKTEAPANLPGLLPRQEFIKAEHEKANRRLTETKDWNFREKLIEQLRSR